jgi:hypothetical protein
LRDFAAFRAFRPMMRRRAFPVSVLLLGALALPGAAPARERCPPRGGERVVARSADAVLLLARLHIGSPREAQRLTGCARRSGERHTLLQGPVESQVPYDGIVSVRLDGTHVVSLSQAGDHLGGTWIWFSRGDALHSRLTEVRERPGHLTEYAAGPRGEIAWIADGAVRLLPAHEPASHVVATGAALHGLRFRGRRLTWCDGETCRPGRQPEV